MAEIKYGTIIQVQDKIDLSEPKKVVIEQPKEYTKICITCGETFTTDKGWVKTCPNCESKAKKHKSLKKQPVKQEVVKKEEKVTNSDIQLTVKEKPVIPKNYKPNDHDSKAWVDERILKCEEQIEIEELKIKQLENRISICREQIEYQKNLIESYNNRNKIVAKNPKLFKQAI